MIGKIRKKQIIIELFGFITRSMIKNNISNPLEVKISLIKFEKYINEKLDANIHSIRHIYQQIRSYEREQHIRLFKKIPSSKTEEKDDVVLSLIRASHFHDKVFLHMGLKMAIAQGGIDLINHIYEHVHRSLNIYLSAGSESYYFAQLLFQDSERELNLYTHNLGIIEYYINHFQRLENIRIYTRFGTVSCDELAVLEKPGDNYADTKFDAIIASTTSIDENGLYIESDNEIKYKKDIFQVMKGPRILLLTLLEYNQPQEVQRYKYAEVSDFDYVVIPSENLVPKYREGLEIFTLNSFIKYFNYEVLSKNSNLPDLDQTG